MGQKQKRERPESSPGDRKRPLGLLLLCHRQGGWAAITKYACKGQFIFVAAENLPGQCSFAQTFHLMGRPSGPTAPAAGPSPYVPVLFAGLRHSHAFYPTVCTGRMIRIAAEIGASGRKGGGRTVPDVAERSGPAAQGGIKEGRGIDLPERSCRRQQGSDPRRRSQGGVSRECWRQGSGISAADSPHGPQVFFFRQRRR